MDFFSAVADPTQPILHNDRPPEDAPDSFADAIASRFGSTALLTTRLTPVILTPPPPRLPSSPMASMSLATPPSTRTAAQSTPMSTPPPSIPPSQFTAVSTQAIHEWIDDSTTLILDIRPHAAHSAARIPRGVSLSVPSTLLKRPLFSLQRLTEMLPSANARARFSAWRSASRILVYDADSSAIPESSNIYGLLRKFKSGGFQGELAWLKGGFQVVWREKRDIIDTHPPTPDAENDDDDDILNDTTKSSQALMPSSILRTRHLPMSAFSFSSTTVSSSPVLNPTTNPKRGPLARGATFPTLPTPFQNQPQPAFNPFFDAVRQNIELSQGITERIPLRLPRRVRHRIHDLPFPWLREIARRAAKLVSRNRPVIDSSSSTSEESEDDENVTSADVDEGKEALAMQFFKVEVAEQRRLMGIMEHHSKETTIVTTDASATTASSFPYSITAGVEKGAKNRYRHIWPFEHARVRLMHQNRETDDDYVNASYIQPLGTTKRYIATQGPLPSTFTDFWTLCWEQNVHVIVMLTREVENSMVKCGSYWTDTVYGPLRLRLLSSTGVAPAVEEPNFFGSRPMPQRHITSPVRTYQHRPSKHLPRRHSRKNETIRRVFELTHTNYPKAKPRRIIHLQYLDWPDMNVPDDPRGILGLIKEVEDAVNETKTADNLDGCASSFGTEDPVAISEKTGIVTHALGEHRPVLLHCSAGVGRTGGFIAVDAILDAIKREVRNSSKKQQDIGVNGNTMDVDMPIAPTPIPSMSSSVEAKRDSSTTNKAAPLMDTVSITITVGREHMDSDQESGLVVHTPVVSTGPSTLEIKASVQPDSEGTEPEASESDREISSCEKSSAAASSFKAQTMRWVKHVSNVVDAAASSSPSDQQQQRQAGSTNESRPKAPSPSGDTKLPSVSEASSSSGLSLLDLVSESSNRLVNSSGSYHFPQSSSLATSVSGLASPAPSFSKHGPLSVSPPNITAPDAPSLSSVDHIPSLPDSDPLDLLQEGDSGRLGLDDCPRPEPNGLGGDLSLKQSAAWLGENTRRRSPSPMARAAADVFAGWQEQPAKPPSALQAPPYAGALSTSSDPESPSGSPSPSADEGSVASQVSSYHTYLKNHHYQPLHTKSLPVSLDKPNKGRNTRNAALAVHVLGRPSSPTLSQSVLNQTHSTSANTVNYKEPRALHDPSTPLDLTCFEDPICEVIQDMREQRMSLCQSLRQYVFVHAAVIEGALMIVDEEKELLREKERDGEIEMGGLDMETEEWKQGGLTSEEVKTVCPAGSSANPRQFDLNPDPVGFGSTPGPGIKWGLGGPGGSGPGPFERRDMASTSVSSSSGHQSSWRADRDGNGNPGTENEGYCVEENSMDADFFSKPATLPGQPYPPAVPSLQRPQHPPHFDSRFGKRSTSPADYLRDGSKLSSDDSAALLLKRPSVKRKQPSGEGEIGTRNKRAQNESSSRERARERERERERQKGRGNNSRDVGLDGLTSSLTR